MCVSQRWYTIMQVQGGGDATAEAQALAKAVATVSLQGLITSNCQVLMPIACLLLSDAIEEQAHKTAWATVLEIASSPFEAAYTYS